MGQAQGYGAGKGQAAMNPMNAGAGCSRVDVRRLSQGSALAASAVADLDSVLSCFGQDFVSRVEARC